MLKAINIPTSGSAGLSELQDVLNVELGGGFEIVQVHDNILILEDGAALGHSSYELVPLPANMNTDDIDAALNAPVDASPSASLLSVHPNFAIFAV